MAGQLVKRRQLVLYANANIRQGTSIGIRQTYGPTCLFFKRTLSDEYMNWGWGFRG